MKGIYKMNNIKKVRRINNTCFYGKRRNLDIEHRESQIEQALELYKNFRVGEYENVDNLIVEMGRATEFLTQMYNSLVFREIGNR